VDTADGGSEVGGGGFMSMTVGGGIGKKAIPLEEVPYNFTESRVDSTFLPLFLMKSSTASRISLRIMSCRNRC
jgi:hypothetical protein